MEPREARDVIADAIYDHQDPASRDIPEGVADSILAALAAEGWSVVKLEETKQSKLRRVRYPEVPAEFGVAAGEVTGETRVAE